jgi:hypothetical protein
MSTIVDNIRQALENNDIVSIGNMAAHDRKVMSRLIRLAYAKDTLIGWRAILAVGMAARTMISTDPAFLRETCRKLLWSLTDESGGIGWSAPELLGEIVSADPVQFKDIVPLIASVYEVEEDVFRAGVLYALARIAEKAPELAISHQKVIIRSLADKDPLVRIRGIRLVTLVLPNVKKNANWTREYIERIHAVLEAMKFDDGEAWIYGTDGFESVIVKDESNNVLNIIA